MFLFFVFFLLIFGWEFGLPFIFNFLCSVFVNVVFLPCSLYSYSGEDLCIRIVVETYCIVFLLWFSSCVLYVASFSGLPLRYSLTFICLVEIWVVRFQVFYIYNWIKLRRERSCGCVLGGIDFPSLYEFGYLILITRH